MAKFTNSLQRIKAGMAVIVSKIPARKSLCTGSKIATIGCSILVAARLGYSYVKKEVEDGIRKGKQDAHQEIKATVKKHIDTFILECVLRWLIYLSLIFLAYVTAKAFYLRKDALVAFAIAGIYLFYMRKLIRMLRWYVSFLKFNGLVFNPLRIARSYMHAAVLDRVNNAINGLSFPKRLAMDFFGPASDKLAREITDSNMESITLRKEALTRIALLACGWLIYWLIYEKLFLIVTGIDLKSIWDSLVWPFHVLHDILAIK